VVKIKKYLIIVLLFGLLFTCHSALSKYSINPIDSTSVSVNDITINLTTNGMYYGDMSGKCLQNCIQCYNLENTGTALKALSTWDYKYRNSNTQPSLSNHADIKSSYIKQRVMVNNSYYQDINDCLSWETVPNPNVLNITPIQVCKNWNNYTAYFEVLDYEYQNLNLATTNLAQDQDIEICLFGVKERGKNVDVIPEIFDTQIEQFAWWNSSFSNRTLINTTSLSSGTAFIVNGSNGFNIDCAATQYVWAKAPDPSGDSIYIYHDGACNWTIANETTEWDFDVESGVRASLNGANVWSDYLGTYHMADTATTIMEDSTSNNYDGVYNSNITNSDGYFNKAVNLTPGNRVCDISNQSFLNSLNNSLADVGCIELWFKSEAADWSSIGNMDFFQWYTGATDEILLRYRSGADNDILLRKRHNSNNAQIDTSGSPVDDANWGYYTVCWDNPNNNASWYYNSTYKNSITTVGNWSVDMSDYFRFFAEHGSSVNHVNGWIDEIRVRTDSFDNKKEEVYNNAISTGGYGVLGLEEENDQAPVVTFLSQDPSDLNTSNAFGVINITYNITDAGGDLNTSRLTLYYLLNDSSGNVGIYTNGSEFAGWKSGGSYDNSSDPLFSWAEVDNTVLPGTYNYDEDTLELTVKNTTSLTGEDNYLKVELYNISTDPFGFYEIMINTSSVDPPKTLRTYYCNSSYTTGNVSANNNCILFNTLAPTATYNHCHTGKESCHQVMPFNVNSSGFIGDVKVSDHGYFVHRGQDGADWVYNWIEAVSRTDAIQTSSDTGSSYSNFSGTVDAHLHQFSSADNYNYYVEAYDDAGSGTNSTVRQDTFDLEPIDPTAPDIYAPVEDSVNELTFWINYTACVPSVGSISYYNITLYNSSGGFVSSIQQNNSDNLSYDWDSSSTGDGEYLIGVRCTDSNDLTAESFQKITLDNNDAPVVTLVNVANLTVLDVILNWTILDSDGDDMNITLLFSNGTSTTNPVLGINATGYNATASVKKGTTYYFNVTASNDGEAINNVTTSQTWFFVLGDGVGGSGGSPLFLKGAGDGRGTTISAGNFTVEPQSLTLFGVVYPWSEDVLVKRKLSTNEYVTNCYVPLDFMGCGRESDNVVYVSALINESTVSQDSFVRYFTEDGREAFVDVSIFVINFKKGFNFKSLSLSGVNVPGVMTDANGNINGLRFWPFAVVGLLVLLFWRRRN
jgi:hypothetical protein